MTEDTHIPFDERDDDALAAEYVLGVLDETERRAVASRILQDATFAQLVEQWEVRLADLNTEFAEVPPPASLKASLSNRLFSEKAAEQEPKASDFWNAVSFWKTVAAVAVLLVVILTSALLGPSKRPVPGETYVASLEAKDSDIQFVALYDTATGVLKVKHTAGQPKPAGKDFELWFIADGAPAISIGLVGEAGEKSPAIAAELREKYREGITLAISLEPTGGSPTGVATGPVIAIGTVKKI